MRVVILILAWTDCWFALCVDLYMLLSPCTRSGVYSVHIPTSHLLIKGVALHWMHAEGSDTSYALQEIFFQEIRVKSRRENQPSRVCKRPYTNIMVW